MVEVGDFIMQVKKLLQSFPWSLILKYWSENQKFALGHFFRALHDHCAEASSVQVRRSLFDDLSVLSSLTLLHEDPTRTILTEIPLNFSSLTVSQAPQCFTSRRPRKLRGAFIFATAGSTQHATKWLVDVCGLIMSDPLTF